MPDIIPRTAWLAELKREYDNIVKNANELDKKIRGNKYAREVKEMWERGMNHFESLNQQYTKHYLQALGAAKTKDKWDFEKREAKRAFYSLSEWWSKTKALVEHAKPLKK